MNGKRMGRGKRMKETEAAWMPAPIDRRAPTVRRIHPGDGWNVPLLRNGKGSIREGGMREGNGVTSPASILGPGTAG
jgi:hypothetical protein